MNTTDAQPSKTQSTIPPDDTLPGRIAKLAGVIGAPHFPNADRAALKRWAPGESPPLTFYRVWLRSIDGDLPSPTQTQAWMIITWGLALGVDHQRGRALGRVLAESRYAEARLERLLAAPLDILPDLFASLMRFLAAKGEAIDWLDAAPLLLTQDTDKRESTHRRIASDFFRHLPRAEKE
ncbi:MAG: type I-E CRISPR-associated protein Cse2/CasB [Betaproteobacteria bacterium]